MLIRNVFFLNMLGLQKVLATCLIAPRLEYRLRELDSYYLEALKQELLSRPMTCSKLMIVVAKGLTESTDFKEAELDSYSWKLLEGTTEGKSSCRF